VPGREPVPETERADVALADIDALAERLGSGDALARDDALPDTLPVETADAETVDVGRPEPVAVTVGVKSAVIVALPALLGDAESDRAVVALPSPLLLVDGEIALLAVTLAVDVSTGD